MINEMGSRGWELACMLETPEVTNVGLGTITYKVLFFFQRKIMQGQSQAYGPPPHAPYYPSCPSGPPGYAAQGNYSQYPPSGGYNYRGAQSHPQGPPPPYSADRVEPSAPPLPDKH